MTKRGGSELFADCHVDSSDDFRSNRENRWDWQADLGLYCHKKRSENYSKHKGVLMCWTAFGWVNLAVSVDDHRELVEFWGLDP